ncbi:MAG: ATP-binding protein [Ignavibacteriaceae bacterium]
MKSALENKFALFTIDLLIIFFCAAGYYQIYLKATLPFNLSTINDHITITDYESETPGIIEGNILLSIDDFKFNNWEEVELYLDGKVIGDRVKISIYQNGTEDIFFSKLTHYYSTFDLLIIGIVGLFFIVFAILVKHKSPQNKSAKLFYLSSLGLAMVIIMTAGNYTIAPFGYGYINRILWLTAYSFTPVFFIHFTLSFVKTQNEKMTKIQQILYYASGLNAIVLSYFFLSATLGESTRSIGYYVFYYDSFFRLYVVSCIVIAISICVYAYRHAPDREERKRLQWLLLGFFIGPFSFVLLWILPILFTGHSFIPEALVLIFLTAIPITFSIAIIRYHLMDINLIVRRSLVYSTILALIIATYIGLSSLITLFVQNVNPAFPSIITAVLVVVALQPIKTVIQKFVDKKFFRVEYDFREEQRKFLDDIKASLDIKSLAEKIVTQVNALIQVENLGFFILSHPDNRIKMIANQGWDLLKGRSVRFETENLKSDLSLPVAVDDKIEPGLKVESADVKVFKRWGMVLVFPVKSPTGIVYAFIALGSKKSGTRYYKDDIDLLNTVAAATALAIERIKLQEELIFEKLEAERLEELNKMKSFFVSTVSHDLKTPLTSIKMFTELLQSKLSVHDEKSKSYLKIIDGESDKLRRLIDNILDFTKIEKGLKSYEMKKVDLAQITCRVVNDLQYQVKMAKQEIIFKEDERKFFIQADEDAVERAVVNLVTNAIKYSSPKAKTKVSILSKDDLVAVQVKDEGRGINREQQEKIFNPYYRSENETWLEAKGTGLGLTIVKHIIDAHNGKIDVESEVGKGSTFTIWFPAAKAE